MTEALLSLPTANRDRIHAIAADLLVALDQRYTSSRRILVQALVNARHPLTISEILAASLGMPQSTAYRNLTVLCEAGVARRLPGLDDLGRYELAEDLAHHHHHVHCLACGTLLDFVAPPALEEAMVNAARLVAAATGFEIASHRLDFDGHCPTCR